MDYQNEMPQDHPMKSIPASIEAERAVLGSLLLDDQAIYKVIDFLKPGDFYREKHAWIYSAMLALNMKREPIDYITLSEELEKQGKITEIGGASFLTDLISTTVTAIYAEHYARIVVDKSTKRKLIRAGSEIVEMAYRDDIEITDMIDKAEQLIFAVGASRLERELVPIAETMPEVINQIDFLSRNKGMPVGVPTGLTLLDYMLIGGLQKSDLIVLAARPGMGKTSLSLSIAKFAAQSLDKKIAIFSLEMSREQLIHRLLSMETGINGTKLKTGDLSELDEWPLLLEGANSLAQTGIYIDDTSASTVSAVRSKCRRLYAEGGLDMILIDYMQLMDGEGNGNGQNRQQEISMISRQLKNLARELNVPVLALSQLSRAVESRADKRPMLSDLRESGSIEQDSDVVLFIYREDYYIPDTDRQNIADIIVAKHRHGGDGTVSTFFRKELTQFKDLDVKRTDLDGSGEPYDVRY